MKAVTVRTNERRLIIGRTDSNTLCIEIWSEKDQKLIVSHILISNEQFATFIEEIRTL